MYSNTKRTSLPFAPTQNLPSQTMERNRHHESAMKDENNIKHDKMKITNQQKRLSVESASKWNLSTSVSSVSAAAAQSFRHKMQEAEMLELQAVQMERRGMFLTNTLNNNNNNNRTLAASNYGATNKNDSVVVDNNEEIVKEIDNCEQQGITLMQQALQIRAEERLDLQNKMETLSAQQKLQANRKALHASNAQELSNITSELNYLQTQLEALTHEQLNAVERLLIRCNVVAIMRFKQNDFDTAIELLEFCLSATEMNSDNNNNDEESATGVSQQTSNHTNRKKKSHLLFPWECDGEVQRRRLRGVTLNNYGCCERRRGHFSQALHYLQESVRCTQVESPVAFMNMSAILTQLMCPAEAVEMAERAIVLLEQPSSSSAARQLYRDNNNDSLAKELHHNHDNEEEQDLQDDLDEEERPALLAVAHHNLAMALEPMDPNRALEEYELAFTYSCNVLGKENDTTIAIQQSWNRFVERRHECANLSTHKPNYTKKQLYHNFVEADKVLSDYSNHIFPHPFVYEASRYDSEEQKNQASGRSISPHTHRITAATIKARRSKHEGNAISQRVLSHSRFAGSDVISPREAIAKLPFVPSTSPSLPSSRSTHKPSTKNNTLPLQTLRSTPERAQTNVKFTKKEQRESKRTPSRSNDEQANMKNNIHRDKNKDDNLSAKERKENALSSTLPPFASSVESGQQNRKMSKEQKEQRNIRPSAHTMPARALSPLPQRHKRQQQQELESRKQQWNREQGAINKVASRTSSNSPITKTKRQKNLDGVSKSSATRTDLCSTSPQKYKPNKVQEERDVTRFASSVENVKREPRITTTRTPQLTPRSAWSHTQEKSQNKEQELLESVEKKLKTSNKETQNNKIDNNARLAKLPPLQEKDKHTTTSTKQRLEKQHQELQTQKKKEAEMKNKTQESDTKNEKNPERVNEVGEWERDDAHVMSVDALLNTETKTKTKRNAKLSKSTPQDEKTKLHKIAVSPSRAIVTKSNTSKRFTSPSSAKNVNTSNIASKTNTKSSKTTMNSSHKNKIATIHATQLLHQVARGYRARRLLYNSHVKRIKEEEARIQETEAQRKEAERQLAAVNTLIRWWRRRRGVLHAHRIIQEKRVKEQKELLEQEERIRLQLRNKLNQRKKKTYTFTEMKHAAIVMQSVARGWLARQSYKHAKQLEQKGQVAATHIQRLWRGVHVRSKYKELKAQHALEVQLKLAREVQYAAALCIQRQWRRFAVQKEIKPQLAEWHATLSEHKNHTQEYAARCVQCAWRVYKARNTLNTLRQIKQAEVNKQMNFMRRYSAVCTLQSFARMILVQRKYHNEIMAAKKRAAQHVAITQPNYKAACVIQRAYKMYVARTTLASLQLHYRVALRDGKRAALAFIIQNVGRGYLARRTLARSAFAIWEEHAKAIETKLKYETGRRLRAEWRALQESIAASLEQVCKDEKINRESVIEANEKEARHALRGQIFVSKRAIQQSSIVSKQPYAPENTHEAKPTLSMKQRKETMLQNRNENHNEVNNVQTASFSTQQPKDRPLLAKLQINQDQPIELGSRSSSTSSSSSAANSAHDETSTIPKKQRHGIDDHITVLTNFGKVVCAKKEKICRRTGVEAYLKEVESVETQQYQHQCALLIFSFLRTLCARKLLLQRKCARDEYLEQCIAKDKDIDSREQNTKEIISQSTSDALSSSLLEVEQNTSERSVVDKISNYHNDNKSSIFFAPKVNNAADIVNRTRAVRSSLSKTEHVHESTQSTEPIQQPPQQQPRLLTRLHRAIDAGKLQHSEEEEKREKKKLTNLEDHYHVVEPTEVTLTQHQAALCLTSFCRGCMTRAYFHTLQAIRDQYVHALVELQRNELPDLERGALTRYEHYFRAYVQMKKKHTELTTPEVKKMTRNDERPHEYIELQEQQQKEEKRKQVENERKLDARNVINRFLLCAIAKRVLVQRQQALAHYLHENEKADVKFVQHNEAKEILHNFTKLMRAKRLVALRKMEMLEHCDNRVQAENAEPVPSSTSDMAIKTKQEEEQYEQTQKDEQIAEEFQETNDEKESTLVRERNELERLAVVEEYLEEVTNEEEILNTLLNAEEVYTGQMPHAKEVTLHTSLLSSSSELVDDSTRSAETLIELAAETIVKFMRLARCKAEYIKRRNAIEEWLRKLEVEDAHTLKQSHAANTIISFCKVLRAKRELHERVANRDDYLCQEEHMDEQQQEQNFAIDVIARFARVILAKNDLQDRLKQLHNYLLETESADKQETMQKEAAQVITSFVKIVMAKNEIQKRLHARDALLENMIVEDDAHISTHERKSTDTNLVSEEHEQHTQQEKEQLHMSEQKDQQEEEEYVQKDEEESAIDRSKEIYHAACVVQHFFRQVQAKSKLRRLRQQEHERIAQGVAVEELLDHASTTIQKHYRGHLARSYVSALKAYIQLYRLNEIHLEGKDVEEQQQQQHYGSNELVQSSYEYKEEQQRIKLLHQQQQQAEDRKDETEDAEIEEVASSYVESDFSDDNDDVVNNEVEVEDSSDNSHDNNNNNNHYIPTKVEGTVQLGESGICLSTRKVSSPDPECSTAAPDESEDRMLNNSFHDDHHYQE